jgi:PEGA domain
MKGRNRSTIESLIAFMSVTLTFSLIGISTVGAQPKRSTGVKTDPVTAGPKRSTGVREEQSVTTRTASDLEKVLTNRPVVRSKGVIVVIGVPGAEISFKPFRGESAARGTKFQLKGQNNTLTLSNLEPGAYLLAFVHPDYLLKEEKVTIGPGEVKVLTDLVVPKFGEVVIGGVVSGSRLMINGKAVPEAQLVRNEEDGKITIRKLPEGEYDITLEKAGYDAWRKSIRVIPGRSVPETAEMKRATITLTIRSVTGARVNLDRIDRGTIQPDGTLVVSELEPGEHSVRLSLDGYDDAQRTLPLDLTNRTPVFPIELRRIPESVEASEEFITGASRWVVPSTWQLDRKGLHVSGQTIGLFKDPTEKRAFNYYADFEMNFDARFENGRGVAWIARAKDERNYYLFQLSTEYVSGTRARMSFFICREGRCELKDNRPVVEKLDTPNDSYHIILEARGSEFTVRIRVLSTPRPDDPQKLAVFNDDTFQIGGIGFRGFDDSRALIQGLIVRPKSRN